MKVNRYPINPMPSSIQIGVSFLTISVSASAIIKLYEMWRDRFRIEISYNFRSLPDIGNDITIRNLSPKSITLTHWSLIYVSGKWPTRHYTPMASPEYDFNDIEIKANSSHTLTFSDISHFDWGATSLRGRRIFIRIYTAGRKPITRLVYPQN